MVMSRGEDRALTLTIKRALAELLFRNSVLVFRFSPRFSRFSFIDEKRILNQNYARTHAQLNHN